MVLRNLELTTMTQLKLNKLASTLTLIFLGTLHNFRMDKATHSKFCGLIQCMKPFVVIWKFGPLKGHGLGHSATGLVGAELSIRQIFPSLVDQNPSIFLMAQPVGVSLTT